jgi:hypothetical protein
MVIMVSHSIHHSAELADDPKKETKSWAMPKFESFSEATIEDSNLSRRNTSKSSYAMRHDT